MTDLTMLDIVLFFPAVLAGTVILCCVIGSVLENLIEIIWSLTVIGSFLYIVWRVSIQIVP